MLTEALIRKPHLGVMMKIIILVTIVILIFAGNLFSEISVNGFQFTPFIYIEKQLYSTLEIEHGSLSIYPHRKMEIFTSDHVAFGCEIKKSYFFTTANYMISMYEGNTIPRYFDLNAGIVYRYFSAFIGRVFNLKHNDMKMLETKYTGLSLDWNNRKLYFLSTMQYIDGKYKNCAYESETFNAVALNLQLSYGYRKLIPYSYISISNLHYQLGIGLSLLHPPMIKNTPALVINSRSKNYDYSEEPNIYLYPNDQCDVEVNLQLNGRITNSIPEFNRQGFEVVEWGGILHE